MIFCTFSLCHYMLKAVIFVLLSYHGTHCNEIKQSPKLSTYEQYKDFFQLSTTNYSAEIFKLKDPWIVVFHKEETVATAWKTMAASLRGYVRVGLVDMVQETGIISEIQDTLSITNLPKALVYPHGTKKTKSSHMVEVSTPIEAKSKAMSSIPDSFITIKGSDMENFFMDSFASVPTKFPALIIQMDKAVGAVIRALALRFERYFNFHKIVSPTTEDLSALGLQNVYFDMPAFLVLTTTDPMNPSVNAIFYDTKEMGEINYPNLMRFLFVVNAQYRYLLPGDNMSEDKGVAEMLDVLDIERERFDFVDNYIETPESTVSKEKESHKTEL